MSSRTRFSQAINPALAKLALLMTLDPAATFADLTEAMRRLAKSDIYEARQRLRAYDVEQVKKQLERDNGRANLPKVESSRIP